MELTTLQLFCDVAQAGSFAGAARLRDLDPSSVSRAIAGLEAELRIRLFQRSTRRLSLTEAGAVYLAHAEAVVDELEQARDRARAVSRGPTGTLRLTTSVAFGTLRLVPLIERFRAAFPDLRLELLLTDSKLDLVADRIDLAIRLAPHPGGDLIGAKLLDTRYRLCASPGYLAAAGGLALPSELCDRRVLLLGLPDHRTGWLFRDRAGQVEELPVGGDIVISSVLALREAALAGLGPALLADWMVDADIAADRLVRLLPDYEVTATSFETAAWLLYPSRAFLPDKVRLTIDFLRWQLQRD